MSQTYLKSLNSTLHDLFKEDSRVYLIGEDILDPYGGAFKVSKGLSDKYPERVIPTPISEAGITGIGSGMALRGLRPIVEIMFGDFMTLTMDQILNHISKFRQMYNNKVTVPIVIRTPMGGGRGYGPTHSQSIEKLFLGIPDLKVVAPSHFHDSGELLKKSVQDDNPVLFIENKLLYPRDLILENNDNFRVESKNDRLSFPVTVINNFETGDTDVVVIAYGGMSRILEELMLEMKSEEINITACFPSLVSSVPISVIGDIVKSCGKAIVVEEGAGLFGWSAEITSQLYEHVGKYLTRPVKRIYAHDTVVPAAKHLENIMLPGKDRLESAIEEMLL